MRDEKHLQSALHAGLDALTLSEADERRLLASMKGETIIMKKKLITALVLAALLLLSLTALALTNWDALKGYFETVNDMEASGELARWSDEDKLKLLSAMVEAGLVTEDERLQAALDEAKPLSERAEYADDIIAERYGAEYFSSYTITDIEFPEAARSAEEQAAYEAWNAEYNAKWQDPSATRKPIDQTRTYQDTVSHLTEIGEFPIELIRDVQVKSEYDEELKRWSVTASIDKALYTEFTKGMRIDTLFNSPGNTFEQDGMLCFRFFMDEYGNYLGLVGSMDAQANHWIALADALPIAEKALLVHLDVPKETLDGLTLEMSYAGMGEYDTEIGDFRTTCSFLYRDAEGNGAYLANIDALTGQVVSVCDYAKKEAMREKERAWLDEMRALLTEAGASADFMNAKGEYFWKWSHEERAAWSKIARPIVHGYINEHPEFAQYLDDQAANLYAYGDWNNLISFTQYVYGVPDDKAIAQEQAYQIARGKAIDMGANQRYVDDGKNHSVYYDVTDPARPLWKVHISLLFSAADEEHPDIPTMPWGYFIIIDAYTGEIVAAYPREVETPIRDIV